MNFPRYTSASNVLPSSTMRSDFAETYSHLSDEELLRLALQRLTLTPEAQVALSVEMRKRQAAANDMLQQDLPRLAFAAPPEEAKGGWMEVTVPRKDVRFPALCPACLASRPEWTLRVSSRKSKFAGFYVFYVKRKVLQIRVPSCESCVKRARNRALKGWILAALGFAVALFITVRNSLSNFEAIITFLALCGPGFWLIESEQKAVRLIDFDDDILTCRFKRKEYAVEIYNVNVTGRDYLFPGQENANGGAH